MYPNRVKQRHYDKAAEIAEEHSPADASAQYDVIKELAEMEAGIPCRISIATPQRPKT